MASRTIKVALLSFGKFLGSIAAILTMAILSRILTKTHYAAYQQTFLSYQFTIPFLTLGLPQALYFFLPRDEKNNRSILSGNLLLLFLMGLLFMVLIQLGLNRFLADRFNNPNLSELLLIFSPYALFALPVLSIDACLVSNNRVKTLALFNIGSKMTILTAVVGFAWIYRTPEAAIYGAVSAAFAVFIPAIFLMYQSTIRGTLSPNRADLWEQLRYSVPLGLSAMIGILSLNLDKILVSSMCDPEEFAVYINGAFEIPLISIITGSIISVLLPEFTALYQKEKFEQILQLWRRAMIKSALLIFPVMVFLFALAPEVIHVLFSAKYSESVYPFRIYLLALPLRITHFGSIFMAAGKNHLVVYRTVCDLVINLILSIILIQIFGSVGAAIATVCVMYLWALMYTLFYIQKILDVPFSRLMPIRELTKIFLTVFIPIIIMSPLIFISRPQWGPLILGISGIVYFPSIFLIYKHLGLVDTEISALSGISHIWKKSFQKYFEKKS